MRFMKVLLLGTLIITTGTVLAEEPVSYGTTPFDLDPAALPQFPEITTLKVSPMYLEIRMVLEQSARLEKHLLEELAAATDELRCQFIISSIEQLDLERDLDILKIQAKYAHKAGRWELETRIRSRILDLEGQQQVAAR